jgi:hypothetical protein
MSVQTLIQVRRGSASTWTAVNPILSSGEWGYETDTGRYKIGDGITVWTSLDYAAVTPDSFSAGSGISVTTGVLGSTLSISVTGIPSTLVTDFGSAVNSLITSAAIDIETIQDIIGNSGVVGGFGAQTTYNDTAGLTTVAVTGMALRVVQGSGINIISSVENNNNIYTVGLSDPTIQASDVTDFSSSVSGLLPSFSAGNYVDLQINNNTYTISVTGVATETHSHVWTDIDASTIATTGDLSRLSGVTDGTASANKVLVVDGNKDISGIGSISTTGNITVGGNLVVQGTTTTVNSSTINIGDNIIRVNTSGLPTGGLEVYDGSGVKSIVWDTVDNRWEFSGGNVYTSGNFIGNLTGNADTVTNGLYTTDVGTITSTMIADGTITNGDISSIAGIDVAKLAASGITLGSTNIILGQSSSNIVGLTAISGASSNSPTYLYNCAIDGGTP